MSQRTDLTVAAKLKNRTSAFRAAAAFFMEWHGKEACNTLRGRYNIGQRAAEIYDEAQTDAAIYDMDSPGATLEALSELLDENPALLSNCRLFRSSFSEKDLELMCVPRTDGTTINWTHVRHLCSIKNIDERAEALKLCIKRCWTSRELADELTNSAPSSRVSRAAGAGRTPVAPKSVDEVLKQEAQWTEGLNARAAVWTKGPAAFSNLLRTKIGSATKQELEQMVERTQSQLEANNAAVTNLQVMNQDIKTGLRELQAELARRDKPVVESTTKVAATKSNKITRELQPV